MARYPGADRRPLPTARPPDVRVAAHHRVRPAPRTAAQVGATASVDTGAVAWAAPVTR